MPPGPRNPSSRTLGGCRDSNRAGAHHPLDLVFWVPAEVRDELVDSGVLGAQGDAAAAVGVGAEDVGAGQGDDAADHELLAPGLEGVGLVLEPAGVVAVVGAGGGVGVPAGIVGDAGGDGRGDGGLDDIAEEGVGEAGS